MQYTKKAVIQRLIQFGNYTPEEAEVLYQKFFKTSRSDEYRGKLLRETCYDYVLAANGERMDRSALAKNDPQYVANPTRKEGEEIRSSVQENKMSYENNSTQISETLDFGYGVTVQIEAKKVERNFGGDVCEGLFVVTCEDCKDGVINVGEGSGKTAQHAINAATDAFYYRTFIPMYAGHIEPGLRLEISKEEFDALLDSEIGYQESGIGISGRRYKGEYYGLTVKKGSWRNIAVNFGRIKTTNHWMSESEILKQNFVDSILSGYTLNIDLQKVGWNWLVTVVNNLKDSDKEAAFARYWNAKSEAGTVEKAKKANWKHGRKVTRVSNNDEVPAEKKEEIQTKAEYITVMVGNNAVVHSFSPVDDVELLKTGKYDVLNTRGSKKLSGRNYSGTGASKAEFKGYAVMGYTLKKAS